MPVPTVWPHAQAGHPEGCASVPPLCPVCDIVTTRIVEEVILAPSLLVSFCDWMRQQRGTCDATLYGYSIPVRDLLKKLGEDPGTFDAQNLRQFILDTSQRSGWASAKKCTTAVRMFLRFLIADGKCAAGLEGS